MRFSGHCWRSRDKIISEVIIWETLHGQQNLDGRRRRILLTLYKLDDIGCTTDEMNMAMGDRDECEYVSCYAEQTRPGKLR